MTTVKAPSEHKSPKDELDALIELYLDNKTKLGNYEMGEFEVRFGTRGIKPITKIDHDNVVKKLVSLGFQVKPKGKYMLRVQNEHMDKHSGTIRLSNVRTEIEGLNNIQNYCKTDRLPENLEEAPYIRFEQKNLFKKVPTTYYPVNFDDFNFRVAFNVEKAWDNNAPLIKNLVKSWGQSKKVYRFINRYSLEHRDFPMRVDISIVKDSRREGRNYIPEYNIAASGVFDSTEKYEIELEVDEMKMIYTHQTSPGFTVMLKKMIKYVLCGLQETNYPISYEEQSNTLIDYENLLHMNTKKSRNSKDAKDNQYGRRDQNPRYKRYKRLFPRDFAGPSSYTLQIKNITPVNPDAITPNIRGKYTVTDKADGLRKLLYINPIGRMYLINTNMSAQFTGGVVTEKTLFDSLIDGEHILHNKLGKFINLYAAFDIYFKQGQDVRGIIFIPDQYTEEKQPLDSRLQILQETIKTLTKSMSSVVNNAEHPIKIVSKKFYASSEEKSIFSGCNTILKNEKEGLFDYITDGLIFTPANTGAGMRGVGETPKPFKITWDLSFKWKPPKFNTIDFLVTTQKSQSGIDEISTLFQEGKSATQNEQLTQYKTLILRVGFSEKEHGFINPCENIINDNLPHPDNLDAEKGYKPMPFIPTNPFDPDAKYARIIVKTDQNGNKKMYTEEGEVIEDKMIVEFAYNITNEKFWKWVPLRVRYDKTSEYRAGGRNYGNAYHVANSNWDSIHNPITEEMISGKAEIPNELGDNDVYYNKTSGDTRTRALRDFHNLGVKKLLISTVSSRGDTLIDYAVGKGGDLPKWINAKLSFVFGIDISRDNIENRLDGICARYLKKRREFKIMPKGLFVNGNSALNIKNGDALVTEKGKNIVNAIFGHGPKDVEELGQGVYNMYGKVSEGFNISSIQFAIHYMFESEKTLRNLIRNVSECTKIGGYFIGTSYDGSLIFEQLRLKKKGESVAIREGDKTIWEVTKQYNEETFDDDETSLGYGIDVYQESINKTFREYLVNYNYLTRIMENYGFVPLSQDEIKRLNIPSSQGNFSQLFEKLEKEVKKNNRARNEYGQALNMTSSERRISFLNRYFIFKKVRNVDMAMTEASLSHETKMDAPGPVVIEEPVVMEEPVVVEEPVATIGSVVVEEPVATEEAVLTEEPVVTKEEVTAVKSTKKRRRRKLIVKNNT